MKIEKNKLVRVNWKSKKFDKELYVENIDGLILDSLKIFGETAAGEYREIPFTIRKVDGKTIVCPNVYAKCCISVGERIVNTNVIEIKSEDYIRYSATMGGSYEFVLKNDTEINL